MYKFALLIAMLLLILAIAGCPQGEDTTDTGGSDTTADATGGDGGEDAAPAGDLVARGREIYTGTDYSNTGLTCAHCHAISPTAEQDQIFIAHSGYGAASRGAWKITSQAQLDAGKGYADTVVDAANVCVKAAYMDHGDELIAGHDAEALEAFLESISVEDQPFIIAKASSLPAPGLTPDKANGKLVYEQSCKNCHDAGIDGLPLLVDASEWLNAAQVMAKVRKLKGNWYNDFEGVDYMNMDEMAGGDDEIVNPCNPCGDGHDEHEEHEEHEEHGVFKEGAMPYYGTDILSDQQVVDVAYYVSEDM
jgi:cytochrome c5